MSAKAAQNMKGMCGSRESIPLKDIHQDHRFRELMYSKFIEAWKLVALELKFPSEEKMRPDDYLDPIIEANNAGWLLAQYEDEYEMLQAINVDAFHDAVDHRVELKTVGDVVIRLSKYC